MSEKKPFWKKLWFWGAVAGVVVIGGIASAIGGDDDETAEAAPEESSTATVTVPEVAGLPGDEARDLLQEAGFTVRGDGGDETPFNYSNWDATETDPPAGDEIEEGSTVTLHLVRAEERLAEEETQRESERQANVSEAEQAWYDMHMIEEPIDFLTMDGYENTLDNPLYAIIPGWGGSTNGYLEIGVQETLTEASTERLCINVLNFIGPSFPDIDGIVFTDKDGLDHNCFRSQAPLADYGI